MKIGPSTKARAAALALALVALALPGPAGCMKRRLVVTSDPPGALVTINDAEAGLTPLEADFRYYGEYDVSLTKDGYEPLRTRASARAPVYEYPPLDLAASAMPWGVDTSVRWHFKLSPAREGAEDEASLREGMMDRAREVRSMTGEDR